mmetsp:Transcript_8679/g.18698  ORF Transcript_8679/g.18698 Transcript_8679/m.18698 type:complete len:83 (+) Transcript_8679:226-474(+)
MLFPWFIVVSSFLVREISLSRSRMMAFPVATAKLSLAAMSICLSTLPPRSLMAWTTAPILLMTPLSREWASAAMAVERNNGS